MKTTDNEKIFCKGCGNFTGHTEKSISKKNTGEAQNIICKSCGRVICKINGKKPVIMKIKDMQITNIQIKNKDFSIKSGKIICNDCNKFSGWDEEVLNKTLEPKQKTHLICQCCGNEIAMLIGEKQKKHQKMRISETNKGYAGVKKYTTPKVIKRKLTTPQLW